MWKYHHKFCKKNLILKYFQYSFNTNTIIVINVFRIPMTPIDCTNRQVKSQKDIVFNQNIIDLSHTHHTHTYIF